MRSSRRRSRISWRRWARSSARSSVVGAVLSFGGPAPAATPLELAFAFAGATTIADRTVAVLAPAALAGVWPPPLARAPLAERSSRAIFAWTVVVGDPSADAAPSFVADSAAGAGAAAFRPAGTDDLFRVATAGPFVT